MSFKATLQDSVSFYYESLRARFELSGEGDIFCREIISGWLARLCKFVIQRTFVPSKKSPKRGSFEVATIRHWKHSFLWKKLCGDFQRQLFSFHYSKHLLTTIKHIHGAHRETKTCSNLFLLRIHLTTALRSTECLKNRFSVSHIRQICFEINS